MLYLLDQSIGFSLPGDFRVVNDDFLDAQRRVGFQDRIAAITIPLKLAEFAVVVLS
jgi:hypothetical protein